MSLNPFDEPSFEGTNRQTPTGPGDQPDWGSPSQPSVMPPPPSATPDVDLIDDTDRLEVYIDLPGFTEDDISLRGDETHLVVSGERPPEAEDGQRVLFAERPTRVERSIQLPVPVDIGDAEAYFEHGVCVVSVPKTAAEQYKEIRFHSH